MNETLKQLSIWEQFVVDNEHKFCETFCKYASDIGIVNMYFGSERMYFAYVLKCGQHVGDTIPMSDFLDFYNQNYAINS